MKLALPGVKIFLKMFLLMLISLQVTNLTFIHLVLSTSKIFATDQKGNLQSYMKGLFRVSERQFDECDVQLRILEFGALTFLRENNAVLITSVGYVQMLQNVLKPKLQNLGENATV